jgi:MinD-like ATPase involved in chromosome partitioning or flagellar assembly
MAAAAIAARIRLPVAPRTDESASHGLRFDELGGPLVAVCGLVGGSGASTLAFALARQAARESAAPVLLTESDTHRGGLAVVAGQSTVLGLRDLAQQVADGQTPREPFLELEHGLRLIAAAPRQGTKPEPAQLDALLRDARSAHGLVVVDCGVAWAAARPVLDASTHVIWTVTASRAAVTHARMLMASDALPTPGRSREVLVAVAVDRRTGVSVRALRRLADLRCERLVLAPHADALARGEPTDASMALGRTLTGVGRVLGRRP